MLPATFNELDLVRMECLRMARRRALMSAAAAVIPVPFTDVAADVALLQRITPKISRKFGLTKEQIDEYDPRLAILIYDVSKRAGTKLIGKYLTKELVVQVLKKVGVRVTATNAAKYVPLIGQAISATLSYVGMRYILRTHIEECYRVARTVLEAPPGDAGDGGAQPA